jgi:hypothetical protein
MPHVRGELNYRHTSRRVDVHALAKSAAHLDRSIAIVHVKEAVAI